MPQMEAHKADLFYDCNWFRKMIEFGEFPEKYSTKDNGVLKLNELKAFCILFRKSGTAAFRRVDELIAACKAEKKNIGNSFLCGVVFQIIPEIPYKDADHYVFRLHIYETIWENL